MLVSLKSKTNSVYCVPLISFNNWASSAPFNKPSTLLTKASFLASSIIPVIIGVAITAIIANITITANNSIKVKPLFLLVNWVLPPPHITTC